MAERKLKRSELSEKLLLKYAGLMECELLLMIILADGAGEKRLPLFDSLKQRRGEQPREAQLHDRRTRYTFSTMHTLMQMSDKKQS